MAAGGAEVWQATALVANAVSSRDAVEYQLQMQIELFVIDAGVAHQHACQQWAVKQVVHNIEIQIGSELLLCDAFAQYCPGGDATRFQVVFIEQASGVVIDLGQTYHVASDTTAFTAVLAGHLAELGFNRFTCRGGVGKVHP